MSKLKEMNARLTAELKLLTATLGETAKKAKEKTGSALNPEGKSRGIFQISNGRTKRRQRNLHFAEADKTVSTRNIGRKAQTGRQIWL